MKKVFIFIFFTLLFLFIIPSRVKAKYDPTTVNNNIYGMSIINHSDTNDVSNLVNVNGGDWGYITVVITEDQRNKEVWQRFLDDCRKLHLIPIVRIATKFENGNWNVPDISGIDNWVNFLNSLNWVVENRYIIIGNEPNHAKEWGGKISPSEYAIYLKTFSEKLHNASVDYFVLNAGFDQDAPNSKNTMDEAKFINEMSKSVPQILSYIDGWNSHSYPNPAFSGAKEATGRRSVKGYNWEISVAETNGLKKDIPVFITETGWVRSKKYNNNQIANNLKYAFEEVWMKDKRIVAVTPFILNYTEEPFYDFSWKNKNGSYFPIYEVIQSNQKIKGEPRQKISGEVIFSFLNPLVFRNSDQHGFAMVKNTGQAIWTQSDSNVINELDNEIKISNTKLPPILPFSSGLVVYTLRTPDSVRSYDVKLGFYVKGEKIGDISNAKIISF